jgi:hypothetical protein
MRPKTRPTEQTTGQRRQRLRRASIRCRRCLARYLDAPTRPSLPFAACKKVPAASARMGPSRASIKSIVPSMRAILHESGLISATDRTHWGSNHRGLAEIPGSDFVQQDQNQEDDGQRSEYSHRPVSVSLPASPPEAREAVCQYDHQDDDAQ